MHRLPPVEFGLAWVAPKAGQVHRDPKPRSPEDLTAGVLGGGADWRVAEMRAGHGLDLLAGIDWGLAGLYHQVGLVREHEKGGPHPRSQRLRPVDGEAYILVHDAPAWFRRQRRLRRGGRMG